ncbi:TIGR04282 family arsenosugar biosynthesis glycosyltransferase [Ferruginibacter sp.]
MKSALIIFVRNPILSKVKTRLAATIGDEKTLLVYKHLLQHTKSISQLVAPTKFVFYADYLNEDDVWNSYEKRLQTGNNLGERMKNAFEEVFSLGFNKICIIGSDCYELTSRVIAEAFENLQTCKTVIGPAIDGGYYLLGMQHPFKDIFSNIEWSTEKVFIETINKINMQSLTCHLLTSLNDIDEEKDLRQSSIAYLLDK